jgi:hypothetical protein
LNPITRMMKRYIKTPLKYALPLLFIGSLVLVSISGCTSSTNTTSSATPTATPAANTNNVDAMLASIMGQIPKKNNDTSSWGAQASIPGQVSRVSFSWGNYDGADISHFNTVANATIQYNKLVKNYVNQSYSTETPVFWGLSYYTNASGHAPTVKNAQTFYVGGDSKIHESFIQYDNVVIDYSHNEVASS